MKHELELIDELEWFGTDDPKDHYQRRLYFNKFNNDNLFVAVDLYEEKDGEFLLIDSNNLELGKDKIKQLKAFVNSL